MKALELGLGGNEDDQRMYWGIVGELLPLSALHHAMFLPTLQRFVLSLFG